RPEPRRPEAAAGPRRADRREALVRAGARGARGRRARSAALPRAPARRGPGGGNPDPQGALARSADEGLHTAVAVEESADVAVEEFNATGKIDHGYVLIAADRKSGV